MPLPSSKVHNAIAPQNPSTIATTAQRSGQGMALRTFMRGALIVSRLLSNLNLICGAWCPMDKAAASANLLRLCRWQ